MFALLYMQRSRDKTRKEKASFLQNARQAAEGIFSGSFAGIFLKVYHRFFFFSNLDQSAQFQWRQPFPLLDNFHVTSLPNTYWSTGAASVSASLLLIPQKPVQHLNLTQSRSALHSSSLLLVQLLLMQNIYHTACRKLILLIVCLKSLFFKVVLSFRGWEIK